MYIMAPSIGGLLVFFGSLSTFASMILLVATDYSPPPIPTGYVIGLVMFILGAASIIANTIMAIRQRKKAMDVAEKIMLIVLGCGLVGYAIRECFWIHPLELSECLCPANTYSKDCLPCPNTVDGVCNIRGVCDDGKDGSGVCFCDVNWSGDDTCSTCSPTFTGELCDTCKRGWTGENCDTCYPGYSGSDCNVCAEGWIPETDVFGVLCRRCKPGHFGGFCEPCGDCTKDDALAVCRDNEWHEDNLYNGDSCIASGQTCSDKYECDSFNCKGICTIGDVTTGDFCETDLECGVGTCEFKQCCVERRHGDGNCECGSIGKVGPRCEVCPGFDGIYSGTICTGHGTCAAEYAGDSYVGLTCICSPEGSNPYPTWSGDTCSCLKDKFGDSTCSKCATGSYGPQCNSCPGGSGIGQCNMHGKCSDGVSGDGTCDCDIDVSYGGIGAFKGASCSECLSDDFYSDGCQPCPSLQVIQCIPGLGLTEIPGVGSCVSSCGDKSCNVNGICE